MVSSPELPTACTCVVRADLDFSSVKHEQGHGRARKLAEFSRNSFRLSSSSSSSGVGKEVVDSVGGNMFATRDEPDSGGCQSDNGRRSRTSRTELANPGVSARLTQLLSVLSHDKRVVKKV